MKVILLGALILVVWLVLQLFIFPKLGVRS